MAMRPLSLFARVLLVQAASALLLLSLVAVLFYVDRNVTIARMLAERWSPALRAAAGQREPSPELVAPRSVESREALPALAVIGSNIAPRIAALRAALRDGGIAVRRVAFSRGTGGQAEVWVEIEGSAGTPRWLGFSDNLIEPNVPHRVALALLLGGALLAGASWLFARRLTGPLAMLRQRMEAHEPGRPAVQDAPLPAHASPEIVAIADAWQAMRERLARHEQERTLMLAGISHDLRSPLARIRLAAGLLPDEPGIAPRRDSIVRNVQLADSLIESFLDLARAGEWPFDQSVDLVAVARQMLAGFDRPREELQAELPQRLEVHGAHALLLERALTNLVDNAFKHGRPPVQVRLHQRGDEAHLEVEDGGDGIAPAERDTALKAFARGDASRGRPGSGLGLAIVRQVVLRMHGRIEFIDAPGRHGLRMALPLAPRSAQPGRTQSTE